MQGRTWMNLETSAAKKKKKKITDIHILYDLIYMKCSC